MIPFLPLLRSEGQWLLATASEPRAARHGKCPGLFAGPGWALGAKHGWGSVNGEIIVVSIG